MEKRLNAELAWMVSLQILENWDTGRPHLSTESLIKISSTLEIANAGDPYPETFMAEHINWLAYLNVTVEKPLLINAQCWRLFYLACLAHDKQSVQSDS